MLPLNVNFGLFALFSPLAWVYDLLVLILESFLAVKILLKLAYNGRIYFSVCLSNLVSGIAGFALTLLLTGGWILVIWQPYVGPKEIMGPPFGAWGNFILYYVLAFVLSVGIEFLVNWLCLKSRFDARRIWKMTLLVNIVSYIVGSVFIYSISFHEYLFRF